MSANDCMSAESWRPIIGYEGLYEVSDHGRVRSLRRRVRIGWNTTRTVRPRFTQLRNHKQGYLTVDLQRGNRSRPFLVHRIVVTVFIGNIRAGLEVNHKDGDKRNNVLSNLEIVTRQKNIDHAVATGLIDNKGARNSQAKITDDLVKEIRSAYTFGGYRNGGQGYKALSKRFGLSWGTIRNIIKRRIWRHV